MFRVPLPCLYNRHLLLRGIFCFSALFAAVSVKTADAQRPRKEPRARTLLLPQQMVSGERATLAVLDANGRLTPGVTVQFSNGDRFTTDVTGRALFVAPLNPGVIFASIAGRSDRVPTVILSPSEAATASMEISGAPSVATLTDRFELLGRGFCGDADANQVTIGDQPALVLASSPATLVVLPPTELEAGAAKVEVACAKRQAPAFTIALVELGLQADSSPLKPGEHRTLTVRVRGSTAKVFLEARNLAPRIAELAAGNLVRASSTGGTENVARFHLTGRINGSFAISIRLLPSLTHPQ
jgi:phage FluMu protein gp41